jgi:hypothetical protein
MPDITTLAAWGEFLGGIGVIASLVYLASQIRQNSKLLRVSATSTTSQLHMGGNELVIQDTEVSRLFYAGLADLDSLSGIDETRFGSIIGIQVQGFHQSFEFHKSGLGSEASWCWTDNSMRWFAEQPGFRSYWLAQPQSVIPAFRDYVDGLIREAEAAA